MPGFPLSLVIQYRRVWTEPPLQTSPPAGASMVTEVTLNALAMRGIAARKDNGIEAKTTTANAARKRVRILTPSLPPPMKETGQSEIGALFYGYIKVSRDRRRGRRDAGDNPEMSRPASAPVPPRILMPELRKDYVTDTRNCSSVLPTPVPIPLSTFPPLSHSPVRRRPEDRRCH